MNISNHLHKLRVPYRTSLSVIALCINRSPRNELAVLVDLFVYVQLATRDSAIENTELKDCHPTNDFVYVTSVYAACYVSFTHAAKKRKEH